MSTFSVSISILQMGEVLDICEGGFFFVRFWKRIVAMFNIPSGYRDIGV